MSSLWRFKSSSYDRIANILTTGPRTNKSSSILGIGDEDALGTDELEIIIV